MTVLCNIRSGAMHETADLIIRDFVADKCEFVAIKEQ